MDVNYKLRSLLMNYDLEIACTDARRKKYESKVKKYESSKDINVRRKYFSSLVRYREEQQYLEELNMARYEVVKTLQDIFKKYDSIDYSVWYQYFVLDHSIQEIAEETHYSIVDIKEMILKFKRDMIPYLKNNIKEKRKYYAKDKLQW